MDILVNKTTHTIAVIGALAIALVATSTNTPTEAQEHSGETMQTTQPNIQRRRLSPADVRQVAPALEAYTQQRLYGEVWKRPGLAPAIAAS